MMLGAILADLGVRCPRKTLTYIAKMDKERNRCKIKAITVTQKRRRRLLKSQFLAAESSRRKREKDTTTTYRSGGFGTELSIKDLPPTSVANSDDSDTICEKCQLRNCPIGRNRAKDDWICCELWFHCRCMNVSLKDLCEDPYICEKCDIEFESNK